VIVWCRWHRDRAAFDWSASRMPDSWPCDLNLDRQTVLEYLTEMFNLY
jgi:hypothetical protein